jgi:hypothetical protein
MRDQRRLGPAAAGLIVVTVVLVIAAVALNITGGSGAGRGNRSTASPTSVDGPKGSAAVPSSPVGKPAAAGHDEPGAISAARSIVAMEPALVAGDDAGAARLVATWAARSAAAGLMDLVRRQRTSFAQAPGGPYSFDVAPLAAKASSTSSDAVTVQLWCAEVVFAKGKPSYGSYVTESLHLIWEGGAWRLVTTVDQPGPAVPLAPGNTPTSAEDATSRLVGFGPVGLLESGT